MKASRENQRFSKLQLTHLRLGIFLRCLGFWGSFSYKNFLIKKKHVFQKPEISILLWISNKMKYPSLTLHYLKNFLINEMIKAFLVVFYVWSAIFFILMHLCMFQWCFSQLNRSFSQLPFENYYSLSGPFAKHLFMNNSKCRKFYRSDVVFSNNYLFRLKHFIP